MDPEHRALTALPEGHGGHLHPSTEPAWEPWGLRPPRGLSTCLPGTRAWSCPAFQLAGTEEPAWESQAQDLKAQHDLTQTSATVLHSPRTLPSVCLRSA